MRYGSLDGLRGVAAFVVLIFHSLMTLPAFAEAYFGQAHLSGILSLLDDTPLHILWAGPDAVYVFFVLSGLVLALAVRGSRFEWGPYYPSRLVRLYLPVVAAVVLCAPLLHWAPPTPADASALIRMQPTTYGLAHMMSDVTLLGGISGVNGVLWSLQWEVVFSLLLPVFIVIIRRRHLWWQVPALIAIASLGLFKSNTLVTSLPMFGLGVAMAAAWEPLRRMLTRPGSRRAAFWWGAALIMSTVFITSAWVLAGLGLRVGEYVVLPLKLIGVCTIVLGAAFAPGFSSVLASRPFRFLGSISFSLYLVHWPVLAFFARLLPDPATALLISVPTALAFATAFWWFIERHAHRLARAVRDWASTDLAAKRRVEAEPAPTA